MIPSIDLIEPRRRRLTRWIGAATLISALHIGGGSFAMLYWQEELVEEAPGAIVVEIAPVATALAIDMLDLPPGPLADERERRPLGAARSRRSRRTRRKRICPRRRRTRGRAAEAHPGRGDAQGRAQGGAEPASAAAQEQVAANQDHGAARIQRRSPTKAAAPEVGTASQIARSIVSVAEFRECCISIGTSVIRPARAHDMQGDVHVRFSIDRSGQLTASQIARSSGFPLLDEEALALLKRASPLPRPPVAMQASARAGRADPVPHPVR